MLVRAVLVVALLSPFTQAFTFTTSPSRVALIGEQQGTFVAQPSVAASKRDRQKYTNPFARTRHIICAGWGPDPIWETCTILSSTPASKQCVEIKVQVPGTQAQEYSVPGQYVQMRVAGDDTAKPIFLAIASPPLKESDKENVPESVEFEFLIKRTDTNGWIFDAAAGSKVDVSQVLGKGFPVQDNFEGFKYDFPTQNVMLFACGTGIAPIRAAIESGQLKISQPGKGGRTARLYYGVRTPEDMSYANKFAEWEAHGFEIVPVVSQPEGTGWTGRTGYVQTALEEDGVPIPRNSGALLCGQKGMVDSVKSLLTSAGTFEGRILTNF